MASPRPSTSLLLLLLSLLFLVVMSDIAQAYYSGKQPGPSAGCYGKCKNRCQGTKHKNPCMFFCQKCCAKCRCVPPGTYSHKQVCPCYNNWKTKEGRPKCP